MVHVVYVVQFVKTVALFEKFKEELEEMTHLKMAIAVLDWDQQVFMPKKGAELRAKTIANLIGILHEKFVA